MARTLGNRSSNVTKPSCEVPTKVVAEAMQRLRRADYVELHKIECHYDDGKLTLRGNVTQYYLKQRAFHAVGNVAGMRQVLNEIEVQSSSDRSARGVC